MGSSKEVAFSHHVIVCKSQSGMLKKGTFKLSLSLPTSFSGFSSFQSSEKRILHVTKFSL